MMDVPKIVLAVISRCKSHGHAGLVRLTRCCLSSTANVEEKLGNIFFAALQTCVTFQSQQEA